MISQWDAKAAIRHFNDLGQDFAEADIFDFVTERRERQQRIEEAGKLTTRIRKERAQQRQRAKAKSREANVIASTRKPKAAAIQATPDAAAIASAPDLGETQGDPYANVFEELDIG